MYKLALLAFSLLLPFSSSITSISKEREPITQEEEVNPLENVLNIDLPNPELHVTVNPSHSYTYSYLDEPQYYKNPFGYRDENNNFVAYDQKSVSYDVMNISTTFDEYRGEGVKLAVIDTGIRYDHPAFLDAEGNCRLSELSASVTEISSGVDVISVKDNNGDYSILQEDTSIDGTRHGTSVTGSIFEVADGEMGLGIASEVELIHVKLASLSTAEFLYGLDYVASLNVDILTMSLGFITEDIVDPWGNSYTGVSVDILDDYFDSTISKITSSGTVVLASSGNYGVDVAVYPSCRDDVISVGAFRERTTDIAEYSCFGYNDIMASGTVFAPYSFYDESGNLDGSIQYGAVDGTSFSCPLTAGALALYKSKYPYATSSQMKEALFSSATDLGDAGFDSYYGHGGIDVETLMATEPDLSITGDEYYTLFMDTTTAECEVSVSLNIFDNETWELLELYFLDLDPDTQEYLKNERYRDLLERYSFIINKYEDLNDFMGLRSSGTLTMIDDKTMIGVLSLTIILGVSGLLSAGLLILRKKKNKA